MKNTWRSAAVLGLALTFLPKLALAAGPDLNITTSGPLYLTAKPGQSVSDTIRVQNHNAATEQLKITLEKFYIPDGQTTPTIGVRGAGDTYFDWVHFSRTNFSAQPNVWVDIPMTIDVPTSYTDYGYYYAVVISRATDATAEPGKNVINSKVVDFVLLAIDDPGAKRAMQISRFSTNHHLYEYLPATFDVILKNTGNIHIAPLGNIFLYAGEGNQSNKKPIDILSVNENKGAVLPGSLRAFSVDWTDGFPNYVPQYVGGLPVLDKSGKPAINLKWDIGQASKFRIGRYTARLTVIYNDGKEDVPLDASVSFWVIPWRLIGIIILLIVFAPIGVYFTVTKIIRKINKPRR